MEFFAEIFSSSVRPIWMTLFVISLLICSYFGGPLVLVWLLFSLGLVSWVGWKVAFVVGVLGGLLFFPPLRRELVTRLLMAFVRPKIPPMSETERIALESGSVWVEAELFSGRPNLDRLMNEPYPKLSEEEKAFIDGPLDEICSCIDSWKIWKKRAISDKVMKMIKKHRLFGMIIPKKYGGLGFSAHAHSEVIAKLSACSPVVGITVMVPNSLGPAELLLHFGTDAQRDRYLLGLATGKEIPCFALTEPQAGSDASAIASEAVLFKGEDGRIYMRINWNKRWITLSMISTVIGLAFQLKDPENLLGRGENLGITCGLIPANTKGVVVDRRHDPLGIPFYNSPIEGHDVVVDAEECIIGGLANAGKGWAMLMECLGAGRGISLPAASNGGLKLLTRITSNHTSIRKQFGVSLGQFGGIEEPLSRLAARSYFQEALRLYTISALDQGLKPPVVTAISKYLTTELQRKSVIDAMDVMGGKALSMGPNNLVAMQHMMAPLGVTVEGANILTRTLMIFGQGALRAHPYALSEMKAIEKGDLKEFDKLFWCHIGHIIGNFSRSLILNLTRGYLTHRGYKKGTGRYFQKLSWVCASYAIMTDLAMGVFGGSLKFKEKLTGRYADILIWMYVVTATLRRFKAEGCRSEDRILLDYSMALAFDKIQTAFKGILANFNVPGLGWLFRGPISWWVSLNSVSQPPSDRMVHEVAQLIQTPGACRDRLTQGIYIAPPLARQEKAFYFIKQAEEAEKKVKRAIKKKELPKVKRLVHVVEKAVEKNIISPQEAQMIKESAVLRWEAIQVDAFTKSEYGSQRH